MHGGTDGYLPQAVLDSGRRKRARWSHRSRLSNVCRLAPQLTVRNTLRREYRLGVLAIDRDLVVLVSLARRVRGDRWLNCDCTPHLGFQSRYFEGETLAESRVVSHDNRLQRTVMDKVQRHEPQRAAAEPKRLDAATDGVR